MMDHQKFPFYHISFRNNLQGIWQPKLPDGSELKTEKTRYSEPDDIKRISVSPSLDGCLMAIYPNIDRVFEKYPFLVFHVYMADFNNTPRCRIISTKELTKQRYVHDAHMTQENWLIDPCYMRLVSAIRVVQLDKKKWRQYRPFNDMNEKLKDISPLFEITPLNIKDKITIESRNDFILPISTQW